MHKRKYTPPLPESLKEYIRKRVAEGHAQVDIAQATGLSPATINRVVRRPQPKPLTALDNLLKNAF